MGWLYSVLLGVLQGLTEYLPVSSSGQLALAKHLMDFNHGVDFTIFLHVATVLSTIFVFRKDILILLKGVTEGTMNENVHYVLKILLSCIPAGLVGLFFKDFLDTLEQNMFVVGVCLLVTATWLFLAERIKGHPASLSYRSAWIIGMAQSVGTLPGISRSGSTIATAQLLKVDRTEAAKFSFLMVIPLIAGSILKDLLDGVSLIPSGMLWWEAFAGFLAAFLSGVIACRWMIRLVQRSKLVYFAIYCTIIGVLAILI